MFGVALASAGLGWIDDWTKVSKSRSLGPSARRKVGVQAVLAVLLWLVATRVRRVPRRHWSCASSRNGPLYPILVFLVLAGASNGVNLTDGLDGLAAGCAAIVLFAYTAMTFITPGEAELTLLSASLVGACVGFLWFNSFPAAAFMGDTGSLGLGGAIAALAVMTKTEVLLLVIGGIFAIETLSVAIQVFAFRRFRRRVFLMAPVHHHFRADGVVSASGSWPRSGRRSGSRSTSSRCRDRTKRPSPFLPQLESVRRSI